MLSRLTRRRRQQAFLIEHCIWVEFLVIGSLFTVVSIEVNEGHACISSNLVSTPLRLIGLLNIFEELSVAHD